MKLFFLTSLFLSIVLLGNSQDWQSHYNQAVASYQSENYSEAMQHAEKAYVASASLDLKSKMFSLQLLTVICLASQDYEKGLIFSKDEVALFAEAEGQKSKRYAESLLKRAEMNQALSNWPAAKKDYEEISTIFSESPGKSSVEYLKVQSSYGQVLLGVNDFKQASSVLREAVMGLKQLPDEGEEYLLVLYYSGFADAKSNDLISAQQKLKEFVALSEQNKLQTWPEYAQAKKQLVQIADATGNTTEALTLVQQGDASEEQKARQYLKAAIEFETSQPAEALRYFKMAEESYNKTGVKSNTGFSIMQNYARFLFRNGQIAEAQSKLAQSKQIALKLYEQTSAELGYVLELEADVQIFLGNVKLAGENYSQAFKNFASLSQADQANHHSNAATKLLNANRPDLARNILEAIATDNIFLLGMPEKNQLEISKLYSEALVQLNLTERAINHLTNHEKNSTSPLVKNSISIKLAELYKGSGDWQKAETLGESVVKKSSGQPALQAEALYQLARLRQQMGKYKESEQNYLESIEGYKKLQTPELSLVYNSFATFYITLGNYGAGEKIYIDLLNDPKTSSVLLSAIKQNLAAIYQQTLRYPDAEKLLTEVLNTDRRSIGESHPDFAISLQNLAALYQAMGKFEKATPLYAKALEVDKLNGGDQTLSYANKIANLGTIYQETGEPQKARMMLESALKIREAKLGKEHPDYMYTVYNLAALHQGLGEYVVAAPLYKQVSVFYLKQIKELFPALSDYEKTAYYNKVSRVINDYEEFVIQYQQNDLIALGELFDFRLETKALLLNASTKVRNSILNSGNSDLLTKFTEWLQLKEKLARLASLSLEEKISQQKIIDESQQKANELEKWLSTQSELFAGEFNKPLITWKDIKGGLKPGEAAVEMIRLSPSKDSVLYAALIVRPEQDAPDLHVFANGTKMEKRQFSYYSNTMRFAIDNKISYQIYWQPLEPLLKNVTTVYFSADGVYNKINPHTLYDVKNNQYLVDRLTIRLSSNIRELLQTPRSISASPSASLFGFPDFRSAKAQQTNIGSTRKTSASEIVRNGVADLPGTKQEVNSIEQILKKNQWSVNSYLYKEATEEKIKSIASPDVLHIATHGFFIQEKENETTIVYSRDISLASDNPLTRSGLLLAGVEKNIGGAASGQAQEEDGILTALEVMNLNLERTDLVVLSACETGAGEIRNGEGVYGLQRAFLVSGANSLIMSLWKVNDEATQELMVGFYNQLLSEKDKVTAFRHAQLGLKKKYESPFYWGAFVLIGR
ncbi:MAG: CHAT domain-containing protein [Bacteroidia bacterium]|nr:CHAT domain-containing protein [Bacteroidia bacterium]